MLISFLLPTRGRPALVDRFFTSISKTTSCLDNIEVILYVDQDDINSHHIDSKEFRVVKIIGPQLSMGGYNSACLEKSKGQIIILANDDMIIRTQNWDTRVLELHTEFDDQIYLGYANDLFKKSKFCTFPILSRRTCELLVDPYPSNYRRAFIDVHLFDIFKRLQHAGFDRIRYCDNLIFEHLHYRAGKATFDNTYEHARQARFVDDATFLSLIPMRSGAAGRVANALKGETNAISVHGYSDDSKLTSTLNAIIHYSRKFLSDRELPFRWRWFLWYWFIGRYLAANGFFRLFTR